jgi:hypothetical protein
LSNNGVDGDKGGRLGTTGGNADSRSGSGGQGGGIAEEEAAVAVVSDDDLENSLRLLVRAAEITSGALGPMHPATALQQHKAAAAFARAGRFNDAVRHATSAVEALRPSHAASFSTMTPETRSSSSSRSTQVSQHGQRSSTSGTPPLKHLQAEFNGLPNSGSRSRSRISNGCQGLCVVRGVGSNLNQDLDSLLSDAERDLDHYRRRARRTTRVGHSAAAVRNASEFLTRAHQAATAAGHKER